MTDLIERAERLKDRFRYQDALGRFKTALRMYKNRDAEKTLHCLLSLGDTYRMTGDFIKASAYYSEAVGLSKRLKAEEASMDASVGLGLSLRAMGKWKEALRLFEKAGVFYRYRKDKEGTAFSLWAKAGALRIKGNVREALKTFRMSMRLFASLKHEGGIGYSLCGMGGVTRVMGLYKESLGYYRAANTFFRGLNKDTFGIAYSHCGIGNALRMTEDYSGAMIHFKQALKLYEAIGDTVSYSYTLWSTAKTYMALGKSARALQYLKKALRLFKKTKDPRGIIYCKLGLAELSLMAGKRGIARTAVSSALNEAASHGFGVEKCHAMSMLHFIDGKPISRCYNKLGLKLSLQSIPFNIP